MNIESVTRTSEKRSGHSRRQFLGGALAVAAAGRLLGTAATLAAAGPASKARLWIGAATADITPKPPVALTGFQSVRITRTIQSPLTANVLALESRAGERVLDQAILVACESPMNNYSATVITNMIGPEGAQVLVDRTVEAISELWAVPAK